MAPKTPIGKSSRNPTKGKQNVGKDEGAYSLYVQIEDGTEECSLHDSAEAVVEWVWRWGNANDLCLVSSEWDVQHPRYGWQNAYNVMITTEDFVGDDEELRGFWAAYFKKCMALEEFEAEGEGAKICCYQDATRQPFWRAAGASSSTA